MKKKIYILSKYPTNDFPEAYIFIKNRVEALKDDYDITVISVNINSTNDSILEIGRVGYRQIILNIKKKRVPKFRIFYNEYRIYKMLKKIFNQNVPDLVEVHFSSYYSWIIRRLSKSLPIPYIITEHASFFEKKVKHLYFGRKIKKAIKDADRVLAVSDFLKYTIEKYVDRDIQVVPNIINIKYFKPVPQKGANSVPKMITVGRFDKADTKGYELLIKSLHQLKENQYEFELLMVGGGSQIEHFQEIIKYYDLLDRVTLLGTIPNEKLVEYYNSADFFVSTSKVETFGVAIIEAMSCGLPVVATKSGGPESYVSDEVGLLCEYSIADLVKKIKIMLETYEEYDAEKIRYKVKRDYSEDVYREKMKKIYLGISE